MGINVDVAIPSSRSVPLSLNQGEPLVLSDPRSAVSLAMLQLVRRLAPQVDARPTRGPRASSGGGDTMKLSERMKQSRDDDGAETPSFGTVSTRAAERRRSQEASCRPTRSAHSSAARRKR